MWSSLGLAIDIFHGIAYGFHEMSHGRVHGLSYFAHMYRQDSASSHLTPFALLRFVLRAITVRSSRYYGGLILFMYLYY